MDIDLPATPTTSQPSRRIVVNESSPYDLEALSNTWEGTHLHLISLSLSLE